MSRAAVAHNKTRAQWRCRELLHRAYLDLGHMVLFIERRRRSGRIHGPANSISPTQRRLLLGWEVYAESTTDEFSGGRTREEECDLEDMLRLAGRL
jgi:hypothetical protein